MKQFGNEFGEESESPEVASSGVCASGEAEVFV